MASEAWQGQLAKQAMHEMHAMQGMQAKLTGAVGTRENPLAAYRSLCSL